MMPHGVGVGLRTPHISHVLSEKPDVPWFELLADNWLAKGGLDRKLLLSISEHYPLTLHGVHLSLGSVNPLDFTYLARIKQLKKETLAQWYSEHCSFSSYGNKRTADLLPLPYTEEAITHLVSRIQAAQEFLGETLLIENVSCYVESHDNEMSEAEFIRAVVTQSGCELLLDINNLYVNSVNHQFCAIDYLDKLPKNKIKQLHLAGFENRGNYLLDAHNHCIQPPVWDLFETFIKTIGPIPTLIEWDHDIPDWEILMNERNKAQVILNAYNTNSKVALLV